MYADNHTIIKIEMLESLEKHERKTDIAFNRCRPTPLLSVDIVLFLNIAKSRGGFLKVKVPSLSFTSGRGEEASSSLMAQVLFQCSLPSEV